MSRVFQRIIFAVSVVIFGALGVGYVLGEMGWLNVRADNDQGGAAYRQIGVYAEVLRKVQNYYVTEPNIGDVTTGALHGLLDSLDPDSSYLTAAEYKIYKDHAATDNAQPGITISKRFGYATIVNILPGSPAEQAHLHDGDVIDLLDGQSTHDLPLAELRLMLEGKPGTTVTLSIVRPFKPDPDKIELTRASIAPPQFAQQSYENATILYLKPGTITAARVDEIAAKVKSAGKSHKILLDLRDTSGDDLKQGLRLANLFVRTGTLASLQGQTVPLQTFTADPAVCITDAPVAVLVNRGTYGAPELAAAAIEDLKRGDVVGERTFGEGSVQKTIDLADGAAILLTVAKYQDPDGKKIEDEAVTPNEVVSTPEEDNDAVPQPNGDEPLHRALELLKAKNG